MCPKNKTQHTDQGFASTVLYICQHSRKLLSAKRQLGQCYELDKGFIGWKEAGKETEK